MYPIVALIFVSTTFNSPKVEAINSQNLNVTQLTTSSAIAPAPEWKKFSPDEGQSSILMPGEKISDITPEQSEKPDIVKSTKMYLSTDETNVYIVGYADFKNDLTQISSTELLDFAVQGMLEDGKKLLSQQNITLGAYPGIEMNL
ncbi:MAG: hypothetical protein PUP90_25435 [Nostoc sp. S4]|nr:hypothetical protein [Nostoc sp. S4]